MKKHLFYTFLIILSATATITLLGITNMILIKESYLNTLFGALLIELAGAVIALFKKTDFYSSTELKAHLNGTGNVSRTFYHGPDEVEKAFYHAAQRIKTATKRIIVFAGHAPTPNANLFLQTPKTRPIYLKAIESRIDEIIASTNGDNLQYTRVLQCGLEHTEMLQACHADPQMFEHCRNLFQILSGPSASDKVFFDLIIRSLSFRAQQF